jgi:hypothetical protein
VRSPMSWWPVKATRRSTGNGQVLSQGVAAWAEALTVRPP